MARQYGGDLYDFGQMSDDEIRDVILQHLQEYPNVDAGWVEVDVKNGFVTLSGRVGTDGEAQVIESIIDDVLGIDDYSNELVVDELHRGEAAAGADEANVEAEENESQLGDGAQQQSDTADHLMENLEEQMYGTHDMQASIRDGTPYTPPDQPMPDGYDSREQH